MSQVVCDRQHGYAGGFGHLAGRLFEGILPLEAFDLSGEIRPKDAIETLLTWEAWRGRGGIRACMHSDLE